MFVVEWWKARKFSLDLSFGKGWWWLTFNTALKIKLHYLSERILSPYFCGYSAVTVMICLAHLES